MSKLPWFAMIATAMGIMGRAGLTQAEIRVFPLKRVQRTAAELPENPVPEPAVRPRREPRDPRSAPYDEFAPDESTRIQIPALPRTVPSKTAPPQSRPVEIPSGQLPLEAVQELAMSHNPTIGQARAVLRRVQGQYQQAGLYPNPSGGYSASEVGNEGKAGQQGYFLEQEFVTANKLGLSQQVARQEYRKASCAFRMQQMRVATAVRREFYAVLVAERRLDIVHQLVEITEQNLKATEARLRREEGTRVDVLQAKIEVETAQQSLISAENALQASWKRLEANVGVPLSECQLFGNPMEGYPNLAWDDVWEQLRANSPQLNVAKWEVRRAQSTVNRARVEPIPNVIAQGIHQYDSNSLDQIAGVQVGIAIPVFNRNQGNIRSAEADVVKSARDVQRIENALQRNLADAFRDYSTATGQAQRYRDTIIPAARETLTASRTLFDQGEMSYLQLQTVQRTYTQTSLQYLEVLAELWDNVIAIEGLLLTDGLASPEDHEPTAP